ncbi:hypothetical protein [Rubritalea squalenifaciens]|nr:hypothetical protein [Rubritalea squalenifaciens]
MAEKTYKVIRGIRALGMIHHPSATHFQRLIVERTHRLSHRLQRDTAGMQKNGESEEEFGDGGHGVLE